MSRLISYAIASLALLSLPMTLIAQERDCHDVTGLARDLVRGATSTDLLMIDAGMRQAELSSEGNLPDPTVEGELLFPQKSGESNRWGVSADWELEWPGVYSARRQQARLEGEAAQAEANAVIARRVSEVQSILLDLKYNSTTYILFNQMLSDTDSLMVSVEKAHRGGEMSKIDLSKLRVERARLAARMEQLDTESFKLRTTLCTDYGIAPEDIPESLLFDPLTLQPLEYYLSLYDSLGEAERLRSATLAAEAGIKVARREALPGIGIGYRHAYEDANHFNGAALSLSIPIFSSKNKRKGAELRAYTAASEERIARRNWEAGIRSNYQLAQSLEREIQEIQAPILEGYDGKLLRRAYEGGEWSLIQYLQERTFYIEAMLDCIELNRAYDQAVTTLTTP